VEQRENCSALLKECVDGLCIHLQAGQLDEFNIYLEQLKIWNESVNLTAITNDKEIVIKHFVDSLAGLLPEAIPTGAKLLDIGTGAGFPGIPMKIARPDLQVTLVEPAQKKVSFLYSLVGRLRLKGVHVFYGTFQDFMKRFQGEHVFDRITTRALNPDVMLRMGHEMLASEGRAIVYHAQSRVEEMVEEMNGWSIAQELRYDLPYGFGQRVVSVLRRSKK